MNQKLTTFRRGELLKQFQGTLAQKQDPEQDFNHICAFYTFIHGSLDTYTPSTIASILEQELENKRELENQILSAKIKPNAQLKTLLQSDTPLLKVEIKPEKIYKRIGKDDKCYKYRKNSQYFLAPMPIYKVIIHNKQVFLPVLKLLPNLKSKFMGHVAAHEFEFMHDISKLQLTFKALELRLAGLLPRQHTEFENFYQDQLEAFIYDTPLADTASQKNLELWIKKSQTAIHKNQDLKIPSQLTKTLATFQTHSQAVFDKLDSFKVAFSIKDFEELSFYKRKYQAKPDLIWIAKAYLVWQANLNTILTYYRNNSNLKNIPSANAETQAKLEFLNHLA